MRRFILFFYVACISLLCAHAQSGNNASDTLLNNIQDKIDAAFTASFQDRQVDKMKAIDLQLKKLPASEFLRDYWLAYSDYYQAVFYIKFDDKKQSKKMIETCIYRLENRKDMNAEGYALLAMAQSFSLQFATGMKAGVLSSKVRRNAEKACELDPSNLRAWYVRGSNDYYTPKQFGGGEKVEGYLLKAIALNEQAVPNPYLPKWGKSDAYGLLIAFYMDKNDKENAKKYIDKGLALFPDDYMINQYAEKLKTD